MPVRGTPWDEICGLCTELGDFALGFQRMLFPYFVLHDHIHAKNVVCNARALSDIVGPFNEAEYAALVCASYLHDVGMALPPGMINKLSVHERYIGSDSPDFLNKLHKDFREYFEGGSFKLKNSSYPLSSRDADAVRKVHPWIGGRYVESYLPDTIEELSLKFEQGFGQRFPRIISTMVRWHSKEVILKRNEHQLEGYKLDLGKLSAVLRLADAMDFSRGRTKFISDHLIEEVRDRSPSQLKHWIFKMAVKSVHIKHGVISVEINESISDLENECTALGVLLFEVAENLSKDLEAFTKYTGRDLGLVVRFEHSSDGEPLNVNRKMINECSNRIKGLNLQDEYSREIERRISEEYSGSRGHPTERVDFFDILAHALLEGDQNRLYNLLDRAKSVCPEIRLPLSIS